MIRSARSELLNVNSIGSIRISRGTYCLSQRRFSAACSQGGRLRGRIVSCTALVLLAVIAATFFVLGQFESTRRDPHLSVTEIASPLTIAGRFLDLGRVPCHVEQRHLVELTNTTDSPISIDGIVASCSCTKISPKVFTIQPNATVGLELEFLPSLQTSAPSEDVAVDLEFRSGHLTLLSTQLKGIVYNPVVFMQRQVPFNAPPMFGQPTVSGQVCLLAAREVESIDVNGNDELSIIDLQEREVLSGTEYTFRVLLPAKTRVGEFIHSVHIGANIPGCLPAVASLPCTGVVKSDIRFWPAAITLVGRKNDEDLAPTPISIIELQSLSMSEFTVLSVECENERVTATLGPNGTAVKSTIHVQMKEMDSLSSSSGRIRIVGNSSFHGANFDLIVPFSMIVLRSEASIVPALLPNSL